MNANYFSIKLVKKTTNPLIFLAREFLREVDGTVVLIGCSQPCVPQDGCLLEGRVEMVRLYF